MGTSPDEVHAMRTELVDISEMKTPQGYEAGGFYYHSWDDVEDDNRKTFHEVAALGGKYLGTLDWSPYSTPTVYDFELWVELDRPKRITNGPLNRKDLET